MKVIDLLNKIANGEEVPKKIQYNGYYFKWTGMNYYCNYEDMFLDKLICLEDLEYPIEIIEEDKEIEKIAKRTNKVLKRELIYKINELVRAVNELKKGK